MAGETLLLGCTPFSLAANNLPRPPAYCIVNTKVIYPVMNTRQWDNWSLAAILLQVIGENATMWCKSVPCHWKVFRGQSNKAEVGELHFRTCQGKAKKLNGSEAWTLPCDGWWKEEPPLPIPLKPALWESPLLPSLPLNSTESLMAALCTTTTITNEESILNKTSP
jgi:hypothetical protein